ncbi:MAG: GNAT family N-acetyltransferase [Acidobacteriota bacterium]
MTAAPELINVQNLTESERAETLEFLNERPVHTVVMTSFILDNGICSQLNRGDFYGHRNAEGRLDGVALIGHTTLVEARSADALKALAFTARRFEPMIHLVMSNGDDAAEFWSHMTASGKQPRLAYVERLFELSFPFPVPSTSFELTLATEAQLLQIAEAQAEMALLECGKNPLESDREGFLQRVVRRIDQGRIFVVVKDGKLIFKADVIAETTETAYLEGVYVAPEYRGKGIGSSCLAQLSCELLNRVHNVCLLSNVDFEQAHTSYLRAGFKASGHCTTLFA